MKPVLKRTIFFLSAWFGLLQIAIADVALNPLFSNHMVLQRNKPLRFWGTAQPGENITLQFAKLQKKIKAGSDGKWLIELPAQPAGGPYEILCKGKNSIRISDVFIGEVWIASGQSNMEWKLKQPILNGPMEIAQANFPLIRFIDIKNRPAALPQHTFQSSGWQLCSSQTAPNLSAIAYFFGREIFQKLNIPIGLILCEWGGTPAQAWTSKEGLAPFPEFNNDLAKLAEAESALPESEDFKNRLDAFNKSLQTNDAGTINQWHLPETGDSDWPNMAIPALWEGAGLAFFDGAVWFRKTVELTAEQATSPEASLHLSKIDDMDSTWINGVKIGGMRGYDRGRNYSIPNGVLKSGANTIAVRVIDWGGGGGLWGDKEEMLLKTKAGNIPLSGQWKYKIGCKLDQLKALGDDFRMQNMPSALFNGMLHPLIPYGIQGVIWYQGESNTARAKQYEKLFPAMITDWRNRFQLGDFPFLFVQLANYRAPDSEPPAQSDWAELREVQAKTLSLPATGMATAIDIGEANDIHPKNKQDVGFRLALIALNKVYGLPVPFENPMIENIEVANKEIVISIKHIYNGLKIKDKYGYIKGFALAGPDKKFVWARAELVNNRIRVWSETISEPKFVRYGWANNPEDINIYNSAGLPLIPFRNDE